jgi:hypothetical protein
MLEGMDGAPTSDDLLAHFDRPKTLDLPDFAWGEDVIPIDSSAATSRDVASHDRAAAGFIEVPRDTRRGVCWVLGWASALAVLVVTAGVLVDFACLLAAERALSVAARAGAMEATLPRATYQSVTAAVERRLRQYPALAKRLHITVFQNGTLVPSRFRQHDGDRFAVALSAPDGSAFPAWLRALVFWRHESEIQVDAERELPSKMLAYSARVPDRN